MIFTMESIMKRYLAMLAALLGLAGCASQPSGSDGAALTSVRWELTSWQGTTATFFERSITA